MNSPNVASDAFLADAPGTRADSAEAPHSSDRECSLESIPSRDADVTTGEASPGRTGGGAHPDWSDRATALSWWPRFKISFVRGFLLMWVRLFGLDGLYRFGQFFGWCEFLVAYKRRRRVNVRIAQIFPEGIPAGRRRHIASRYFRRTRCDKMIYCIFDRIPADEFSRRIHFPRQALLDSLLARGKGVYVAMSHHGPHHVAAMIMAQLGYRLAGVRDRNESALRRFIQRKFAETFPAFAAVRMFFADAFPRDIFRCYRENYVIASALDVDEDRVRDGRLRTIPVTLFGEQRPFLIGPIQMAQRCEAPVLQGFVMARRNFHYELVIRELLPEPDGDASSAENLARTVQQYADGIAEHVRRHPCHLTKI